MPMGIADKAIITARLLHQNQRAHSSATYVTESTKQ